MSGNLAAAEKQGAAPVGEWSPSAENLSVVSQVRQLEGLLKRPRQSEEVGNLHDCW